MSAKFSLIKNSMVIKLKKNVVILFVTSVSDSASTSVDK